MIKTEYKIEGMSCNHCVIAVKKELEKLNITNPEVSIGKAIVEYDEKVLDESKIIDAIDGAGYKVIK